MATCECGCGSEVRRRFVSGHNRRGVRFAKQIDETAYEVQDCGFETPCWMWTRARSSLGYGQVVDPQGRRHPAYRYMYETTVGPVPPGLELHHLCENPPCINPAHLKPVTHAENIRVSKRAKLTMEKATEIRRLYALGRSKTSLAQRYGVTGSTIHAVILGKTWV